MRRDPLKESRKSRIQTWVFRTLPSAAWPLTCTEDMESSSAGRLENCKDKRSPAPRLPVNLFALLERKRKGKICNLLCEAPSQNCLLTLPRSCFLVLSSCCCYGWATSTVLMYQETPPSSCKFQGVRGWGTEASAPRGFASCSLCVVDVSLTFLAVTMKVENAKMYRECLAIFLAW